MGNGSKKSAIKKSHILIIFIVVSIIIFVSSFFYFRYGRQYVKAEKQNELKAIAELKVSQVANWNKQRITDAKFISQSPFFTEKLEDWIRSYPNKVIENEFLKRISLANMDTFYSNISIADTNGKIFLSLTPIYHLLDSISLSYLKKAIKEKKVVSSDLYLDKINNEIKLDYIAPVLSDNNAVIGTVIFTIDPNEFLYPLINEWPVPSRTSETLIIRKENGNVLYLNELSRMKDAALNLTEPLTKTEIPAVQAGLGNRGIFEGTSYYGKKVLAYIKPIPETKWIMIAQEDEDEVYEDLYFRENIIISFTILLVVFLAAVLVWLYNSRQKRIYRELFAKEKELREYHEEFRTILYSIGDGVITTDLNGRIKQLNFTSENLTGWKEAEAIGKPVEEVFKIINEETRATVENPVKKVLAEGIVVGLANHTLLVSKDGTETPIADSGAPIRDVNGNIEGVVLVFRDKTEEKEAEKIIRQSEARLRRAELISHSGNFEFYPDTKTMIVSEGLAYIYGVAENEFDYEILKKMTLSEYRCVIDNAMKNLIENNETHDIEFQIKTVDKDEVKDIRSIATYDTERKIIFGVMHDITDWKKLEQERYQLLNIIENSWNEIYVFDSTSLKFEYVNKGALNNLSYTFEELKEMTPVDIKPEFTVDAFRDMLAPLIKGEEEISVFQTIHRRKNGTTYPVEVHLQFHKFGNKSVFFAVINDITEKIIAEERIEESNKKYMTLFNSMNEGVALHEVIFDSDKKPVNYKIVDMNPAYEKHTGIKLENAKDKLATEVYGTSPAPYLEVFTSVGITQIPTHFETYFPPLNRYFNISIFSPKKGMFATVFTDITESKLAAQKIEQSEKRFRSIVEDTEAGYFFIDKNGIFRDVNQAWCRLYKYSLRDEVIGKHFALVQKIDKVEDAKTLVAEIMKSNPDYMTGEFSRKCKDGSIGYHTFSAKPVYDFDKVIGIEGFIIDTTEIKKAENTLREREEQLRTTLYSIGDAVIATDENGLIKQLNPIAHKLTGWSEVEAKNKPLKAVFKIINEYTRKEVENPVNRVLREGVIIGLANHTLLISKEGKEIPIADSGAPIRNKEGKIIGVVLVFRDQSKERNAQKILEESEVKLKMSQRVSRTGYFVLDFAKNEWTSSEMAEEIFGIDKSYQRTPESWLNIVHPDFRDQMTEYFKENISKGQKGLNNEYKIQRISDKKELWVYDLSYFEYDSNGIPTKMFGTVQDITERKEAENKIIASLKEKEILLKEIHHRVKNNFQQIIGLITIQTEFIEDETITRIFEDLQTRLRSMSLIHELMYQSENFTGVSIKDYIERLTQQLINTYSNSDRIQVELDMDNINLDIDTIIPLGLMTNEIITNSIKYAFPKNIKGTISISFKKIEDQYLFTFSDDGIGIKEKINIDEVNSLGMRLVRLLTMQLRGTLEIKQPEKGLQYLIKF